MFLNKKRNIPGSQILAYSGFGILFLLAIALRVSLYPIVTSDYTVFISQWYDFITTHGGFAALKYNFSNYNPPYLYLLAITTFLPISKLVAIKSLSVLFDGILGLFAYRIISLRYRRSFAAIIGALVILFAPTIVINSAAWGQSDAIYTAFCLGSLYFLLKERPAWAYLCFGLAISFKLQAIFFLPVLFVLLLRKKLLLRYLTIIPATFLVMLTPALIAGRDLGSLLSIYVTQITSGGTGTVGQFNPGNGRFNGGTPGPFNGFGPGQFHGTAPGPFNGGIPASGNFSSSSLTLNAPSFYQWLPANAPDYWKWVGIVLAILFILLIAMLVVKSKQQPTSAILLKITLVFALAIPFLLPEMHERYFYLADVVSIIYAFYFPRKFYIPIGVQLCSLLSYAPYFLNTQVINLAFVAFAVLVITVITLLDLIMTLYPTNRKSAVEPAPAQPVEALL